MALLLMSLDIRSASFHHQRQHAELLVLPLQKTVSAPVHWASWINNNLSTQQHLLEENTTLKANQLLLQSKLNKMVALQQENSHLKALLQSSISIAGKVEVAQLLAITMDPSTQQIMINKGKRSGVMLGQPVLDAYGVLGQVISLNAFTSRVLLINDKQFAIPVEDKRSGVRAIAIGTGRAHDLVLTETDPRDDIQMGDSFVTSGFGLKFPKGYPVGTVKSKKKDQNNQSEKITLTIAAHLNSSQQVLLAWPNQTDHTLTKTTPNKATHDLT